MKNALRACIAISVDGTDDRPVGGESGMAAPGSSAVGIA